MIKRIVILLSSISVLLVSYQNCSDVRLEKIEPSIALRTSFSGEFCSKTTEFRQRDVKLVFMIDMSSSNVELGNDTNGERLDLVENLLTSINSDSSCFQGANLEIAVLGFASEVVGGTISQICSANRFVDPATALSHLQDYKSMHQQSLNSFNSGQNGSPLLGGTSYQKAVECVSDVVTSDLPAAPERSGVLYQNFFLTDGDPTDGDINNPNRVTELSQLLSNYIYTMKTAASERAYGLNFQPVLYGNLVQDNGSNTEFRQRALQVLGEMAFAGSSFIRSVAQVGSLDFCGLASSGSNTTFKVKRFGAINLTAKAVGGSLVPDSDMDGIADRDEAALGFDPTQARSSFIVLDGICKNGICDGNEQLSDCGGINGLGMSKCDIDKLNLSDGLDSDKDLIPDFVELLKGTDPVDINENFRNSDNDSMQNFTEILQGSDPLSFNESLDPELLMRYTVQKEFSSFPSCPVPQESWSFKLENVPLVPTLATNNQDSLSLSKSYLNHEAGENIILVYYIASEEMEQGESSDVQYLYGEIFKLRAGDLIPEPQGFRLLGTVDGNFLVGN